MNRISITRTMRRLTTLFFGVSLTVCHLLSASEYSFKTLDKNAPDTLSASIRAELGSQAIQVLKADKPIYEIWLRKALPLKNAVSSPGQALNAVGQTTLMGAISVLKDERDYRDDEIYGGDYTIRFGLRPEDGNHLGTSDHLYFAVLIATQHDQDLGKIVKSRQLVKASSKESANDHPIIMSLYPVSKPGDDLPAITEPAHKHTALRLSLPTKSSDGTDGPALVFDLIIDGVAEF